MRMMMKVNRLESDVVDKEEANEVLKNDLEELVSKHEVSSISNSFINWISAKFSNFQLNFSHPLLILTVLTVLFSMKILIS